MQTRPVRRSTPRFFALAAAAALVFTACANSVATPTPAPRTPGPTPTPTPLLPTIPAVKFDNQPLKDLVAPRTFGSAILLPYIVDQQDYADITTQEFNSVTPERVLNWASLEPAPGALTFDTADLAVGWATSRNIAVRGQTLVWDKELPLWLSALVDTTAPPKTPTPTPTATPDEGQAPLPPEPTPTPTPQLSRRDLANLLHDHITDVVSHYAGQIASWDVVKDPLNADGTLRRTIWETVIGPDYLARVLQWARDADPKVKLYISEAGAEGLNAKSDALYALVQSLLARGIPIGGVGFEAHLDATIERGGFPPGVASNLQRFAALGIEVAITELDARTHVPALEGEQDRQKAFFVNMVTACFSVKGCVGVTVWEWSDRFSYIPGALPGFGQADLWDANFNPKPAVKAVKDAIIALQP